MNKDRIEYCWEQLLSGTDLTTTHDHNLLMRKQLLPGTPTNELKEQLHMVAEVVSVFWTEIAHHPTNELYEEYVNVAYAALLDDWMMRHDYPQLYTYKQIATNAIKQRRKQKIVDLSNQR